MHPEVTVTVDNGGKTVNVARSDDERTSRALHVLTDPAVINNMVFGVKNGYEKRLEIQALATFARSKTKTATTRSFANELKEDILPV